MSIENREEYGLEDRCKCVCHERIDKIAKHLADALKEGEGWRTGSVDEFLADITTLENEVIRLEDELDKLEAKNQRLRERNSQSTYCAYCGEDFPLDTEHTTLQVGIHIWECEKHPLNILCEAIDERCKDLDYEAQEYLATGKENDLALSTGIYKALDRIREVISDEKRHCKEMKDEIDALKEKP